MSLVKKVKFSISHFCTSTPIVSCFILGLFVPASYANGTVDFNFEPNKRTLTTEIFTCYPGAIAKSKLKDLVPKVTKLGLKSNIKAHESTLVKSFGVPASEINTHLFALQIKLQQADYTHEFNQVGNETCTRATSTISEIGTAEFVKNLDELIPYQTPQTLFYFGTKDNFTQQVQKLIKQAALPFEADLAAKVTKTIFSNNSEHYLTFDINDYQAALLEQRKVVYLTGNRDSVAAVAAYLSDNGFTLATNPEQAYWQLNTSLDIIEGNDGLNQIGLSLTARHGDVSVLFNNRPADMPMANVNQATILKTTAVHLELMSLAEALLTASD